MFVEDVTIPDGTVVAPDVELVKAWKVKNGGTSVWPEGCVLKMQTGRCGVAPFDGAPDVINARVPPLAPGEEFIAEVQLQTPSEPGRYTAYWRMCDPHGHIFGHRFWTDVVVSEAVAIDDMTSLRSSSELHDAIPIVVEAVELVSEEEDGELVDVSVSDSASDRDSGVEIASNVTTEDDSSVSSDSDSDSAPSDDDDDLISDSVSDGATEGKIVSAELMEAEEGSDSVIESHVHANADDVVGELYDDALGMLEAMGFGDREQNRATLAQWGGNIADAVNSLLLDA